jgi:hypothetical protein
LVAPLLETYHADKRSSAMAQLDKARSEKKAASSIGDVWALAHEGRADLLLVEEDFHYPARLSANGKNLLPADDSSAADVIDDAVDEIIEEVLNKKGRIVFMPKGQLTDHERIALVLRY